MAGLWIVIVKGVRMMLHQASKSELDGWIRDMSRGDRDALAKLYHATSGAVYGYALSIVKNRQDAEDVLHDCYVTLWDKAEEYRSQDKPMAWILTITRNLSLKLLRQPGTIPLETLHYIAAPSADPVEAATLRTCMQVLSAEEREIVVLHAVAGLKHRQIAKLLGIKHATVMSKYRRALQKLKASF